MEQAEEDAPTPDLLAASIWLADQAKRDPDVKAALYAAFHRCEVSNISELLTQFPLVVEALYEGMREMMEGAEDMDRYDAEYRSLIGRRRRAEG